MGNTALKAPCKAATTGNITLSGAQTIDGIACTTGDRVLVKDQTTASENGIYDVDTGAWTRAQDFDGARDVQQGTLVFVNQGAAAPALYRLTTADPITIGTTSLTFSISAFADSTSLNFIQSGTGAVNRTAQNKMREIFSVADFGTTGDGVADDTAEIAACILAAAGRRVFFPAGTYLITSSIELNDQTANDPSSFRAAPQITGEGIRKTRILNNSNGPAFKHTLTQAQGDNQYFSRGLEIGHLEIYGNGSTPAGGRGIALQGTYQPWLHDLLIYNLKGNGIETLSDARWAGTPDSYSCAEVSVERVNVTDMDDGWGIYSTAFSTSYKIQNPYISSNDFGGIYLVGSPHSILGGAVTGNGEVATATSYGIHIARTSDGTPQNCEISEVEIDGNHNKQVFLQSTNTVVQRCRIIDAETGGSFKAAVQVDIGGGLDFSADGNRIESCIFRLDNASAASTIGVRCNLDALTGARTVRYNLLYENQFPSYANLTPFQIVNDDSIYSTGNIRIENGQVQKTTGIANKASTTANIGTLRNAAALIYAASSTALSTSPTITGFGTKRFDTHTAFSTANNEFTAPYAGVLKVTLNPTVSALAINIAMQFDVQNNPLGSTGYTTIGSTVAGAANDHRFRWISGSTEGGQEARSFAHAVVVSSGDKTRVSYYQDTGGGGTLIGGLDKSSVLFEMLP